MRHLTIEEIAKGRWFCSDDLVRGKIKDGSLPAINIGSPRRPLWRIDEAAIERFEEANRAKKPEPLERNTRRKRLPTNVKKFV